MSAYELIGSVYKLNKVKPCDKICNPALEESPRYFRFYLAFTISLYARGIALMHHPSLRP